MKNICQSGGSKGADLIFGECAEKVGHGVVHYSFSNHYGNNHKNSYILNYNQLVEAEKYIKKANVFLKRNFPTRSEYVNNLIRRNYYQIKNSDRIYAVSHLLENTNYVNGGTGFTVMMGVLSGIDEIYLFDQIKCMWYSFIKFEDFMHCKYIWKEIALEDIPFPHGIYTGIGSHELNELGRKEIYKLYNK